MSFDNQSQHSLFLPSLEDDRMSVWEAERRRSPESTQKPIESHSNVNFAKIKANIFQKQLKMSVEKEKVESRASNQSKSEAKTDEVKSVMQSKVIGLLTRKIQKYKAKLRNAKSQIELLKTVNKAQKKTVGNTRTKVLQKQCFALTKLLSERQKTNDNLSNLNDRVANFEKLIGTLQSKAVVGESERLISNVYNFSRVKSVSLAEEEEPEPAASSEDEAVDQADNDLHVPFQEDSFDEEADHVTAQKQEPLSATSIVDFAFKMDNFQAHNTNDLKQEFQRIVSKITLLTDGNSNLIQPEEWLLFSGCAQSCKSQTVDAEAVKSDISSDEEFSLLTAKLILTILGLTHQFLLETDPNTLLAFLNSHFQSAEVESINAKYKRIIFGSSIVEKQQIDAKCKEEANHFNLCHGFFNSLFFVLEKQIVHRRNRDLFDRRELAKKTQSSSFKGGCGYVIMMKQLKEVKVELEIDANDWILATKMLFSLPQIKTLNHAFAKTLREVFVAQKFENTSQEIVVLFASVNLNV